jgi:HK97 gp10 family phage protein
MFALVVKQEGVRPENSNFVKTAKNIEEIIKSKSAVKIAQKGGKAMLEDAKSNVPVRSGNLRDNGIKLQETETGFIFYIDTNAAPYGPLVETGTRKMRAQPYYWPAVDRNRDKILSALIAHYRGKTSG